MSLIDSLRSIVTGGRREAAPAGEEGIERFLDEVIARGGPRSLHAMVVRDAIARERMESSIFKAATARSSTGGIVGISDYGIKGRRQYIAERRRLLDLYTIAMNNADIRTAITHLRNEIFRRGLTWEPAFEFKCDECDETYSELEAKEMRYVCHCSGEPTRLRRPDREEIRRISGLVDRANYFGQSLESILRACEDDINIIDDAFIYLRKRYSVTDEELERFAADPFDPRHRPRETVIQIFRLDPSLVEIDMDMRGLPGQAHHVCVLHRDVVLDVPPDEDWDVEWRGVCPQCGLMTYPVYYRYSESAPGQGRPGELYLLRDEVIHWSRYSPSETYGYPPILSIYEKALTLIGMDRYLYDYFYERKVPQGVIAVTTDDVVSFNAGKAEIEARMQQDPHYIPWVAIASKTGQGRMEFVRFAYSLDELDYLPVRDEIRERIAGIYGVSQIWMQSTEGIGGLNSESQQLAVMSRVVEGAQRSYHTEVFPRLARALGVRDWRLVIRTPEEANELVELQVLQARAGIAQMMVGMGFGVRFDAETKTFSFYGRVPSREEQTAQMLAAQGMVPPPTPAPSPADELVEASYMRADPTGSIGLGPQR